MKIAASLMCLLGLAWAKKGSQGGQEPNPEIVNPAKGLHPDHEGEFAHAEFTEGDMIIKGGNKEDRNAIGNSRMLWPNGRVPYILDNSLNGQMRSLITQSINDYNQYTCVRWVQKGSSDRNYVWINSRQSGCYAYLGMTGGQQPLNLQSPGCADKGTVVHEMLHTIGFGHEQARNDRDNYVTINWHNIDPNMHSQFQKMQSENNQGFPYDYNSVMHYPDWGFSKNGQPVITTRDRSAQKKIGQRLGFSKTDIAEVNKLYNCGSTGSTGGSSGGSSGGGRGGCSNSSGDSYCNKLVRDYGVKYCKSYPDTARICQKACNMC